MLLEFKRAYRLDIGSVLLKNTHIKLGLHLLSFAENRQERIFAANIDEKPLTWFTLVFIRQENIKKM